MTTVAAGDLDVCEIEAVSVSEIDAAADVAEVEENPFRGVVVEVTDEDAVGIVAPGDDVEVARGVFVGGLS